MPWGAAVGGIVSAVVGAGSSAHSSKQAKEGSERGMEQSLAITNKAREDVLALFDRSAKNAQLGMDSALSFYKNAATKRMAPFLQGNQAAQDVIGQGAVQANNAILGLPMDMSFTQQPQVQPDMGYMLGAELPQYDQTMPEPMMAEEAAEGGGGQNKTIDGRISRLHHDAGRYGLPYELRDSAKDLQEKWRVI